MTHKELYTLRVWRGEESIGEYTFNATPEGILQLMDRTGRQILEMAF